ncbi:MAG: TM2 domain-containing protein [Lachnospiraceae bacterium]|nr:TM2 domain-containing protein [Lachnospiraceae bacterium]
MSGKPGAGVYRAPEATCSVELEKPRNKEKSRMTAVLLAFFLGALGAHSFYIGNYKKGALQLLVSLVSMPLLGIPLGMVWGWVDMVRILSGKLDINVSEHKKDTKKEIPQEEAVTYQLSSADYAYRRQHGVIPQLDFMNDKDPLSGWNLLLWRIKQ